MASLSIGLFGRLRIHCDGRALDSIGGTKVQELLAYLLLHRDRPHARESLAALLWGDCPTAQSKKYLRQALWQLQARLGSQAGPPRTRPLAIDPEWVQVNAGADLVLDVAVFEQAFAAAEGVAAEGMEPAVAQALQNAEHLYQGDLLEGCYHDWCLYERERLQNMHLTMLDKLMAYCEARGDFELGLTYGSRILRHDRARECTHQRLMRLHFSAGDRAAAMRQYERCAAALEDEIGVEPSERTKALRDQILAGRLQSADTRASAPSGSEAVAPQLTDVLARLKQLGTLLAKVERQVRQELVAVEGTLKRIPR